MLIFVYFLPLEEHLGRVILSIAVNDVAHFLVFSGGILFWFPLLVVRCMFLLSYLDSIRCFMRFGWYMLMAEQFGCKFCFANSSGTTYVSVCLSRKSR